MKFLCFSEIKRKNLIKLENSLISDKDILNYHTLNDFYEKFDSPLERIWKIINIEPNDKEDSWRYYLKELEPFSFNESNLLGPTSKKTCNFLIYISFIFYFSELFDFEG